jgi:small subunit ribosomal protein S4
MGDPVKPRRKYSKPGHPYEKGRIEEENKLMEGYGLKSKREIWKASSRIRNFRMQARTLLGVESEHKKKREKELIGKLRRIGLLGENATLDDVLSLTVDDMLNRRLQTVVHRKALASTVKQARQLIVHGHIAVRGRRVDSPGYIVTKNEESEVGYYGKPLAVVEKPPEKKEVEKSG